MSKVISLLLATLAIVHSSHPSGPLQNDGAASTASELSDHVYVDGEQHISGDDVGRSLVLGKLFKNKGRGYGNGYGYGHGFNKNNNRFGKGFGNSRFNGGRKGKGSFLSNINNHHRQLNAAHDGDEVRSLVVGKLFKNKGHGYGNGFGYNKSNNRFGKGFGNSRFNGGRTSKGKGSYFGTGNNQHRQLNAADGAGDGDDKDTNGDGNDSYGGDDNSAYDVDANGVYDDDEGRSLVLGKLFKNKGRGYGNGNRFGKGFGKGRFNGGRNGKGKGSFLGNSNNHHRQLNAADGADDGYGTDSYGGVDNGAKGGDANGAYDGDANGVYDDDEGRSLVLGKLFKNKDRGHGNGNGNGNGYGYGYGHGFNKNNNRFGKGFGNSRFNGGHNSKGKGSFFGTGNNHYRTLLA
jgi:hypothetical protein